MPVMTISGVTVAETAGTATLQLTLTNPSRQTITANYMTVP